MIGYSQFFECCLTRWCTEYCFHISASVTSLSGVLSGIAVRYRSSENAMGTCSTGWYRYLLEQVERNTGI
jgi:hypothetical protein